MSDAPSLVRPSVTLKLATSLDGRIALANGESKWITGEAARAEVHHLRANHDAVIVGSETVIADDPLLTARLDPPPERQPMRVVADSRGRVPATAKLFSTLEMGPVAVATLENQNLDHWPSTHGLQFWMLPPGDGGSISLPELLNSAQRAGISSLMVEGGGQLAAAFMRAGLVDRIEWFRAPIILGGDARPCLGGMALANLASAPTYERTSVREIGPDLWESYERKV
ncbi:MAG: riboflavin biosynthesis protein RibD [Bosea sp. 12-68-7]|nr:MAG: riboflavin biosynthesis protein RibD [Bosea sp. 12-68-7]